MKRILAFAFALLLCFAACAQTPDTLEIVNCESWVSLRCRPDSASERFAQVPLGAKLRGFYNPDGEFSYCEYEGRVGYILNEYLQASADDQPVTLPSGEPSREVDLENGGKIRAWYGFKESGEVLRIGCYTETDTLLWAYETESLISTELSGVAFFINEKAEAPMVMVHNSSYGLIALDIYTGETLWTLPESEVSLGASITYAVDADGRMYIGGYYGPDPVCISPEGKVQWESSSLHDENGTQLDFCWLDDIIILSDGIAAHYNNCDQPALVGYDFSGRMISWNWE